MLHLFTAAEASEAMATMTTITINRYPDDQTSTSDATRYVYTTVS
jgi:hypothetical protein